MTQPAPQQSDIYLRTERAYHLAVSLDLSVAHLVEALQAILRGRLDDAHWELYLGDFTFIEPAECKIQIGNVYELPEPVKKRKRKVRAA